MKKGKTEEKKYSDAEIVDGVYNHNQKMGVELFALCKDYYDKNFYAEFINVKVDKEDIFQNTLVTLLEKIRCHQVYAEDGKLYGKGGKPFTSSLTTYFMGIAKLKYFEWVRKDMIGIDVESKEGKGKVNKHDMALYNEILYGDDDNAMLSIIADCISRMSERCSQILSSFYYEEKSLDDILLLIPTYNNKDALKTEKYKCMKSLREAANNIFQRFYQ